MSHIVPVILMLPLALLGACDNHRNGVCYQQVEASSEHTAPPEKLATIAYFLPEIERLDGVQIVNVRQIGSFYLHSITYHYFHHGLLVYQGESFLNPWPYYLKVNLDSTITGYQEVVTDLDTSLASTNPVIGAEEACEIAHEVLNWHKCYEAELMIYREGKILGWFIRAENGPYLHAVISAETGDVLMVHDGR